MVRIQFQNALFGQSVNEGLGLLCRGDTMCAVPFVRFNFSSTTVSHDCYSTVGMSELVKQRPDKPIEWLAAYLLAHDPHRQAASTAQAAPPVAGGGR